MSMNFNKIKWLLVITFSGYFGWTLSGEVLYAREVGRKALERSERIASYLASAREDLSAPDAVEPDSRKLIGVLMPQVERDLAEHDRLAKVLDDGYAVRALIPGRIDRELKEFVAARDRMNERLNALDSTLKDALARGREKQEEKCYCSCSNPGSPPALRGRKTASQCGTLCEQEGFTGASCM